jgi:two-component system OmpR family sensor kinase
MRSIERYLLAWIMGALTLGAVLMALVIYLVTLEEMDEVFDANLKNVAQAVLSYHHAGHGPQADDPLASALRADTPDGSEIVTLTWTRDGTRIYVSDARVSIPFSPVEGLSHPRVGAEDWTVYTSVQPKGVAQAAQRVAGRQEMAGEVVAKIFPPLLGLVVMIGALLVFALRRGLQPLDAAARDVAARSARSLEPIATREIPREIMPLVGSINELMGRLSEAFSTQRRFLADAAHELRSPITALRLQFQLLQRASTERERRDAVADLESGVDRSQRLIEQLLQVSRSEPDGEVFRHDPIELGALARAAVATLSLKAEQHGIDLGATGPASIVVAGDVHQLSVLLNNLVENALRYTPAGGVVDVEAGVHDGRPMLRVIDDGPGIAPAERGRVFDRFFRGDDARALARDGGGSGLGLAIVRSIAERHGAHVSLHTPPSGRGLEVRVVFAA